MRWEFGRPYDLQVAVHANRNQAWVNGVLIFTVEDNDRLLTGGGIALVCEEERLGTDWVVIRPV